MHIIFRQFVLISLLVHAMGAAKAIASEQTYWQGQVKASDALCLRVGKIGDRLLVQDARLRGRPSAAYPASAEESLSLRLTSADGCLGVRVQADYPNGARFDLRRCLGVSMDGAKPGLLDPNAVASATGKTPVLQPAPDGDYAVCLAMLDQAPGCKNPGLRLWQGKLDQGQEPSELLSSEEYSSFEAPCR